MHLNKGQTKKKWQLKYLTKIPFTKAIWYREVIFHSNEQLITEQSILQNNFASMIKIIYHSSGKIFSSLVKRFHFICIGKNSSTSSECFMPYASNLGHIIAKIIQNRNG